MIEAKLQQSLAECLNTLYHIEIEPKNVVLQATKREFVGDFTLVVFPFVKQARKAPEAVANEIGEAVKGLVPEIKSYNVIKGFLNFEIDDAYWAAFVGELMGNENYGFKTVNPNDAPIVVEYSSPNTNKPLHLGHIRNNLLGWSVSQLLAANGANVKKVNLVNDRGIHICKSMLAWLRFGNGETPESSGMKGDHLVGKYYVEFDKHYKEEVKELMAQGMDEEEAKKQSPLMLEAQSMLKRWEEGDKEIRDLWSKMNESTTPAFLRTGFWLTVSARAILASSVAASWTNSMKLFSSAAFRALAAARRATVRMVPSAGFMTAL